jgi:hypothetical protein
MTTTYLRRLAVVGAVLPLVGACGGAGHHGPGDAGTAGAEPVVGSGTHLVITTDNGLRLRPTDGDHVVVDRAADHRWTHRGDTWVLDLSCAKQADGDRHGEEQCPRMPEIDVPASGSVTVSARNAGVDVAGVAAALVVTTVNGDVTVTRSGDADGVVRLSTRNGSVRAMALRAARLHAETVNGDVVLDCRTSPTGVTGATTNGSVHVVVPHDAPVYQVTATTDNGRPSVSLPTDDAKDDRTMTLSTVNGDVGAARE